MPALAGVWNAHTPSGSLTYRECELLHRGTRALGGIGRDFDELLAAARAGDRDALGELIEQHRDRLLAMTGGRVDGRLGARVGASDIVQQTCLSVFRNFDRFEGDDEAQFDVWIQRIHEQNVKNVVRDHVGAQRRAVGREAGPPNESGGGERAGDGATPSQHAMQNERATQLAMILEKLPEDQREAVRLRHLEGWSLMNIAEHMQRSEAATVGLVKRGMQRLRALLAKDSTD